MNLEIESNVRQHLLETGANCGVPQLTDLRHMVINAELVVLLDGITSLEALRDVGTCLLNVEAAGIDAGVEEDPVILGSLQGSWYRALGRHTLTRMVSVTAPAPSPEDPLSGAAPQQPSTQGKGPPPKPGKPAKSDEREAELAEEFKTQVYEMVMQSGWKGIRLDTGSICELMEIHDVKLTPRVLNSTGCHTHAPPGNQAQSI